MIFKIITAIALGVVLYRIVRSERIEKIKGSISMDRNQYTLIIGEDATQIFEYYEVTEMHGLSLDGAISRIVEGGTYIDGLSNYHPLDKELDMKLKPFLFLNLYSIQNNYSNAAVNTLVMHECMHMAGKIYNGCWDSHEEEMITWAEQEANQIVRILTDKKFIR